MADESIDQWLSAFNKDDAQPAQKLETPAPTPQSDTAAVQDTPVEQPQTKQNQDMVERQKNLMEKTDRDRQAYYEKQNEIYEEQKRVLQQSINLPHLSQVQQMAYTAPPNTSEYKQQAFAKSLLVLAAGTAMAYMLGRHNRFAFAGTMKGVSAAINNIAKGYKEEATEALATWNKQNEYIKEENKRRMDSAKEILGDERLSLSNKLKLLGIYAKGYEMPYLQDKAEQKDLHGAVGELTKMEKADADWQKKTWNLNKHLAPDLATEYEQAKAKDPSLKYSDFLRLKHTEQTRGKKKKKTQTGEAEETSLTGGDIFGVTGTDAPTDDQRKAFEKTMSGE